MASSNTQASGPVLVSELKKIRYSPISEDQKVLLKNRGRPTPQLKISQEYYKAGKMHVITFNKDWYQRKKWICGCEETSALYCYPCLLLGAKSRWAGDGCTDLSRMGSKTKLHEISNRHVRNTVAFELLGKKIGKWSTKTKWRKTKIIVDRLIILNDIAREKSKSESMAMKDGETIQADVEMVESPEE